MKTLQISLNSIDKVKSFVNDITKFENDFDLVSGRYVIDAKSIMGIFLQKKSCFLSQKTVYYLVLFIHNIKFIRINKR